MTNPIIAEYGENVTRKWTAPGDYDEETGEWDPGPETIETIFAAVLPLKADDLITEVKAEGLKTNHGISIYSEIKLNESDEDTKQAPDVIVWQDRDYIIYSVSHRYQIPSLAHYKSIAFLIDN